MRLPCSALVVDPTPHMAQRTMHETSLLSKLPPGKYRLSPDISKLSPIEGSGPCSAHAQPLPITHKVRIPISQGRNPIFITLHTSTPLLKHVKPVSTATTFSVMRFFVLFGMLMPSLTFALPNPRQLGGLQVQVGGLEAQQTVSS
jgi:hypothetical protein